MDRVVEKSCLPVLGKTTSHTFGTQEPCTHFRNGPETSERERHLQIQSAVRTRVTIRPARQPVGFTKLRRTQIANRRKNVHVVKHIPGRNAERKSIAMVRGPGIHASSATTTATRATSSHSAGTTTKRTATHSATGLACIPLQHRAKSDGLAQAQHEGKPPRPFAVIHRNGYVVSRRRCLEASIFCLGGRRTRAKGRSHVIEQILEQVATRSDVKRHARACHQ